MNKMPLKDLPIVQTCYMKLVDEFLKYMPHDRFYIAGGFARFCIEEQFEKMRGMVGAPGDVDIYLLEKDDLDKTIKSVHDVACKKLINKEWATHGRMKNSMYNSPHSFTINSTPVTLDTKGREDWASRFAHQDVTSIPVQIIKFWSGTPEEVLNQFDFNCVSVAIDSNFIYAEEKALEDIQKKRLTYNCRPKEFSYNTKAVLIKRVAKYCHQRFYKIYDSELIEDLISDELTKNNEYSDVAYYNQGELRTLENGTISSIYNNLGDELMLALYLSKIEGVKAEKIKEILYGWMNKKKLNKSEDKVIVGHNPYKRAFKSPAKWFPYKKGY